MKKRDLKERTRGIDFNMNGEEATTSHNICLLNLVPLADKHTKLLQYDFSSLYYLNKIKILNFILFYVSIINLFVFLIN